MITALYSIVGVLFVLALFAWTRDSKIEKHGKVRDSVYEEDGWPDW